ncbi:hypothetical protein VOLCADRAFT_100305 [Volvox carteri f. nagariensis]|uniref:ribonuclease Z n=1 Tax=Volvox carteri f. nagariensis TaxID=3068 RepID=D8UJY7_VOLCA|nr:uncharacterized protein VOLCADRAFT_100305 [Volvox carteri f. nagariensis]EFJ39947.1 hypothetical protein VOLCADRAFT_100305 [Volvox carteri f. nagariensis]|eukprot:XP_002958972.1 hypothetical protein VOLCADRAFT_100305 [Volvox carteri f. nagariensis]
MLWQYLINAPEGFARLVLEHRCRPGPGLRALFLTDLSQAAQGGLGGLLLRLRQDGHAALRLVGPAGLYDTVEGLSYFVRCTHPALELTMLTSAQQGCVYDDECLEVRPVWRNSLLWQVPPWLSTADLAPGSASGGAAEAQQRFRSSACNPANVTAAPEPFGDGGGDGVIGPEEGADGDSDWMLNARPRKRKRPRRRQGGGARLGEALGVAGAGAPQQRTAAEDGSEERPLPPRRSRRLYDSSGGGADVAVTKNPGQLNSSRSSSEDEARAGERASAAAAALRAACDTVSRGKEEAPRSVSEVSWDLGSCSTASTTACDSREEAEESLKRTSGGSGGGTGSSSISSKGGVPESGGDSSSDASDGGAVTAAAAGAGGGKLHSSSKIRGDHLDLFSELDRLFMASGPVERRPAGVYGVVRHGRAASGGGAAAARRSGRVLAAAVGGGGGGTAAVPPPPPPPGPAATLTSKVALRSQVLERLRSAVGGHHLETRATLPPQGVRRTAAAAAAAAATPSSTVAARWMTLPGLQPPPLSSMRQPPPPVPQPPPQPSKATRPPDDNPLAYLLYPKHTRQAVLVVATGDLAAIRSLAAHPVSKLLHRAPSGLLLAVTHVAAAAVTWQGRYRQLAERQLPGPHVWLKPAATAATMTVAAVAAVPPPPLAGLGHLGSARVTMRLNTVAPAIFPLPYELRVRQCAAAARRGVANEDVGERGVDAVDLQLEDNIAAAAAATAATAAAAAADPTAAAAAVEPTKPAALREVVPNAGDEPTGPSPQPLQGQGQQLQPPPRALAEPGDQPQLQLIAERGRTAGGSSSGGGGLTAEEELAAAAAAYGTPEHTGGVMRPSYSYALYPENELRALPLAAPPVFGWQCGSNVGGGGAGGGDAVLHSLRRNSDVYGNRLHSPWPAASHGPHGAWTGQPIPLPCLKSRDLLYTSARPVVCKGCTTFTCLSLLQLDRPPLRAAFIHRHCYSSAVFHRWKLRPHDRGLYTANHIPLQFSGFLSDRPPTVAKHAFVADRRSGFCPKFPAIGGR